MKFRIPIETRRLYLDKFYEKDWQDLYRLELTPEYHKHNFSQFNPRSQQQIKERTRELADQDYKKLSLPFILVIRLKATKKFTGFIGFKNGSLTKEASTELFYSLLPEHWNRGYCTEAVLALLEFGFKTLLLHRIFAGCDIDNIASRRVLEKAGMIKESHWRKDRKRDGTWQDGYGYAILEEDYFAMKMR